MDIKKMDEIINVLAGLKWYEWSRVRVCVDKVYNSESSRLELNDTESLRRHLKIEFGCSITPPRSES